jgi:hypothetical protein
MYIKVNNLLNLNKIYNFELNISIGLVIKLYYFIN